MYRLRLFFVGSNKFSKQILNNWAFCSSMSNKLNVTKEYKNLSFPKQHKLWDLLAMPELFSFYPPGRKGKSKVAHFIKKKYTPL